jgi:hypothetical protein
MNIVNTLYSFDIKKSLRLEKALEIKKNFKKIFKQNMNSFNELKQLELEINNWIKYDEHYSGRIYIKNINKYLIYQLNYLEHTFVKITNDYIE